MKKLIFLFILLSTFLNAQVGIGTNTPNSVLDVRGSLQTAYREVTANATLDINDYYVVFNGTAASTITLPAIQTGTSSFTGRIYRIKNISSQVLTVRPAGTNTFRISSTTPDATITLNPGFFVELVNNANTGTTAAVWDASFVAQPMAQAVTLYGATLKLPPYGSITSRNPTYDSGTGTDVWWLISATPSTYEVSASLSRPSRMTIVYEYQGAMFNLSGLQPLLTVGNSSSFPDIFSVSFGGFSNTTGKTRLTVSIARVDFIGSTAIPATNSNWQGTEFFINALFTKRTL
ncbi:hypothetical protein [Chishuiella changwenlii]|uniref:hypothetical protein n=1 Tax=Chishuiella changwenlii TaxID=1434701 RepID=UPI002FD904AB